MFMVCSLGRNQPGAGPSVVPELALGVKAAEQGPDQYPDKTEQTNRAGWQAYGNGQQQRRQKPHPAQQVAQQGAALAQRQALRTDDFDMPGFHGQSLAPVPKPGEVNAQYQKQEGL